MSSEQSSREEQKEDSFGRDWAKVADLEVKACGDQVKVSGVWGESVFGTWAETVEGAMENLKEAALRHDDPRPDADDDVYRTTKDERFNRCLHCDQLPNADHHEIIGTHVLKCTWDEINDFDVFAETDGHVVACPDCGGRVRDRPADNVEGVATVDCQNCDAEFIRESFDFGSFPAGHQRLRNADGEVVAHVE